MQEGEEANSVSFGEFLQESASTEVDCFIEAIVAMRRLELLDLSVGARASKSISRTHCESSRLDIGIAALVLISDGLCAKRKSGTSPLTLLHSVAATGEDMHGLDLLAEDLTEVNICLKVDDASTSA